MSKATPGSMSLYTATCLVVANMVGTGVFTSVGFQIKAGLTPFVILVLWLVGGDRRNHRKSSLARMVSRRRNFAEAAPPRGVHRARRFRAHDRKLARTTRRRWHAAL